MSYIRLIEMFDKASEKIKYPKIKNLQIEGQTITLYRTGTRSKYPGSISVVTSDGVWLGNITRQGTFYAAQGCPAWVRGVLQKLADNPESIASLHGRRTGCCCFCSRLLTDDRKGYSVEMGYGPHCAKRWNLKWGEPTEPKIKKPTKKAYKEYQKTEGNPLNLNFEAWASIQAMGF